jgi:hypothetical protein
VGPARPVAGRLEYYIDRTDDSCSSTGRCAASTTPRASTTFLPGTATLYLVATTDFLSRSTKIMRQIPDVHGTRGTLASAVPGPPAARPRSPALKCKAPREFAHVERDAARPGGCHADVTARKKNQPLLGTSACTDVLASSSGLGAASLARPLNRGEVGRERRRRCVRGGGKPRFWRWCAR